MLTAQRSVNNWLICVRFGGYSMNLSALQLFVRPLLLSDFVYLRFRLKTGWKFYYIADSKMTTCWKIVIRLLRPNRNVPTIHLNQIKLDHSSFDNERNHPGAPELLWKFRLYTDGGICLFPECITAFTFWVVMFYCDCETFFFWSTIRMAWVSIVC